MENMKRGKAFIDAYKQQPSGFWLSIEQLHELANDLSRINGCTGIGFMVGIHERNATDNPCNKEHWYSVEIVPLEGELEVGQPLDSNVKIANDGVINTSIKITHNHEANFDISSQNSEAQRFPPPAP